MDPGSKKHILRPLFSLSQAGIWTRFRVWCSPAVKIHAISGWSLCTFSVEHLNRQYLGWMFHSGESKKKRMKIKRHVLVFDSWATSSFSPMFKLCARFLSQFFWRFSICRFPEKLKLSARSVRHTNGFKNPRAWQMKG